MPLLLCPNDNSGMTTVSRSGVEFDMCPTCRGVWLDRGELEKLMENSRGEAAEAPADPSPGSHPPQAPPQPYPLQSHPQTGPGQGVPPMHYDPRYSGERGEWGERGEYGERGHHGHYGHRKKRFDLFDIFD
ncbi:MAG TPA: zf-TFIIB domain-containing protein [Caulobacteraceae bacterium]